MLTTRGRKHKKSNKARPLSRPCANTSTQPINPLAASFGADDQSLDSYNSFKAEGYEYIDGEYERAEEYVAEKLESARSSLYWKNVWNRAVWRPKPNAHNAGTDKSGKPVSATTKVHGRVIAAGVNTRIVNPAKASKSCAGKITGTKESEADEDLQYSTDTGSEESHSSSSSDLEEKEDLQIIQNIESDEYWTFTEPPGIEDDWDMIPEADRLGRITAQPTFNSLLRKRLEEMKLEREELEREKQGRN